MYPNSQSPNGANLFFDDTSLYSGYPQQWKPPMSPSHSSFPLDAQPQYQPFPPLQNYYLSRSYVSPYSQYYLNLTDYSPSTPYSYPSMQPPQPQPQPQRTLSASSHAFVPSGRVSHTPTNEADYVLDIEKVRRHEDTRTTLMIRNIPNR